MILISQLISQVRRTLKQHTKTGILFTPPELDAFQQHLMTIDALALDQEEEITLLQKQLGIGSATRIPVVSHENNVVRLPIRTRIAIVGGSDGGDAA